MWVGEGVGGGEGWVWGRGELGWGGRGIEVGRKKGADTEEGILAGEGDGLQVHTKNFREAADMLTVLMAALLSRVYICLKLQDSAL